MNIYVGNFSYDITPHELQGVFEPFGQVESVKIIKDKATGDSRGFGFVMMPDQKQAQAAMQGIKEIHGRKVTMSEAKPQTPFSLKVIKDDVYGPRGFSRRERRY